MKVKTIRADWLERDGRRLDCNPYMTGAIEARAALQALRARKEPLHSLTCGHNGGIYNGPQFRRNFVELPEFGVPFLTSGNMLHADLSTLPLLRNRDAHSTKLAYLRLTEGTTLISCSGTIGRMTFVRPDMVGMWSSQDVLKVVPDKSKIPPGFLYAFLSSKFGVPLVVGGTYGAIIQHIEMEHIAGLPVPRFPTRLEKEISALVDRAAKLRAEASFSIGQVRDIFDEQLKGIDTKQRSPLIVEVPARSTQVRLDAQFHNPLVKRVRERLMTRPHKTVGQWCDQIFLPGIFKRLYVEDLTYGTPYYTGYSLFWNEPESKGILSRKTSRFGEVLLKQGMILVQAFGQEGGLTGRPVWVGKHLDGATTTHMLVRLVVRDPAKAAYLFGYLHSHGAYTQLASLPYGGSIPHFDENGISNVLVPELTKKLTAIVCEKVANAVTARDNALSYEREARKLVEQEVEGA